MERESGGLEPKAQGESRGKLQTALRVMKMFLFGIFITAFIGSDLASMRMPHSNWRFVPLLVLLIMMVPNLLRKDDTKVRVVPGCLLLPLFCVCFAGLFFLRAHDWTPIAAGVLFAVFFWVLSKSDKRPYLFLSAGSLLGGVLSLQFPWPNEQRCLLTLVGVGLVATLQGIWIIVRYLQGYRSAEFSEPVEVPKKFPNREFLRLIHLIFGRIVHIQLFSPELVQRIQKRYEAEIKQLMDLGFDYQFSDGETFSIFRLALLFPALILFIVWLNREVIAIQNGTRIFTAYSVFIPKNKIAFGYVSGLGTKFYTAFQDGTILVSKNYGDDDPLGPMIVINCCKIASISETWAAHQKRITELEAEGKRVDRQTSFEVYAEISNKETAPW